MGDANSLMRLGSMSLPRTMSRQMSIYSLTLDEFQTTLGEPGKNFGSMNMDELLKNIWTAEESQAVAAALFSNTNSSGNNNSADQQQQQQQQLPRQPSLIQRQNSLTLLPLPQSLSKKTVDEVWRDIGPPLQEFGEQIPAVIKPRQSTYGEMTLEDFLVKAGVMALDQVNPQLQTAQETVQSAAYYGNGNGTTYGGLGGGGIQPILGGMQGLLPGKKEPIELNDPMPLAIGLGTSAGNGGYVTYGNGNSNHSSSAAAQAARNQAEWMENQYKNSTAIAQQQQQQQQQQQLMQLAIMNGGQIGLGPIVGKESSPGSPLSDAPQGGYGGLNGGNFGFDGPIRGRKRILDAPLEKIVERRQRRMIKNRESAARSRARKQAYTVELEAEVTQLKEENMRLRKMQILNCDGFQEEDNIRRKKQVMEVIAPMTRHLPKMLRRTVTGPW